MSLNFGVLGKVLFSPKAAFESIKDKTTMMDGILMFVILTVIASIIAMVPLFMSPLMSLAGGALITGAIIGIVIAVVIGVILLVAIGWLASVLAKAIGKGAGDVGATVGLLGYRTIIDLFLGVIKMVLMIAGVSLIVVAATMYGAVATGPSTIGWILIAITFVWDLFIGGNAVAVANNTSLGAGIASYFIAALVVGLIIGMILVAVFVSMGMAGVSGFSMWGM